MTHIYTSQPITSVDISLIPRCVLVLKYAFCRVTDKSNSLYSHAFNIETAFTFYGGDGSCDGLGAVCELYLYTSLRE